MPRHLNKPLREIAWVEDLISKASDEETLGDLCKFDIVGIEIPPDELKGLLEARGLSDWMPVDIRKKTAARKAITRIRPQLEAGELQKVIVRPVKTNSEHEFRYAIVDETHDPDKAVLDYATRNQVVFNSQLGTMHFTKEEVPEIREAFDYLCSVYTDAEVIRMTYNICKEHGATFLKDGSGMFFMPKPLGEITKALVSIFSTDLRPFLSRQTNTCYFRPIGIHDSEANRTIMGEALIGEITEELDSAEEKLREAIKEETNQTRAFNTALKKFQVAKGKALLYRDLLQINLDDMDLRIGKAEKQITEVLLEEEAA